MYSIFGRTPFVTRRQFPLDQKFLDFLLDGGDLRLDLRPLVLRDGRRDDGPGDAARPAEGLLKGVCSGYTNDGPTRNRSGQVSHFHVTKNNFSHDTKRGVRIPCETGKEDIFLDATDA